jgi:hypothetical protein
MQLEGAAALLCFVAEGIVSQPCGLEGLLEEFTLMDGSNILLRM